MSGVGGMARRKWTVLYLEVTIRRWLREERPDDFTVEQVRRWGRVREVDGPPESGVEVIPDEGLYVDLVPRTETTIVYLVIDDGLEQLIIVKELDSASSP